MNVGYFDDGQREYIITNPRTPVKWINYIGSLDFGGFVDHTGGALICRRDPALNRITRYLAQLPASDFRGETLYLRLHTPLGMNIISPYFVPGLQPLESYECHVGLGYSRIISTLWNIRTEVTIFVPPGKECEIRDIRVMNLANEDCRIDVIPVVEYSHFDALKQLTNADWVPQTMQSRAFQDPKGRVCLAQYAFMHREDQVNLFSANLPASSFETDRRIFLGENEYGSWAYPLALQSAELACTEANRGDNIAALLIPLGILKGGEMHRVITQLTQGEELPSRSVPESCFPDEAAVDEAFSQLEQDWDHYLGKLQINTVDPALNSMLNIHNPRQCRTTFTWSRYLSLYQLGYGERGIGFRDSAQDTLGIIPYQPEEAKQLLSLLLQAQKRDGSAMHQFNPLTLIASEGDSLENRDRPHYYSDDALWAVLAVTSYLKETGDYDFLQQPLVFYEKDREGIPIESRPVLEHLTRALSFTHDQRGRHGLPLLGYADWNDTVNLPGRAESVFTACLFGRALLEMISLQTELNQPRAVNLYREWYAEMKEIVNRIAWDGKWYAAYFDEFGNPVGSHLNSAGKIFAYPQAWAVISGFAEGERAEQALNSVASLLDTRNGIKLSSPAYTRYDPAIGGISTYPPGAKENGGIFLHVNPWVIYAETLLGHGERAYECYARINPAARNDQIEVYEAEPYVYAQNILGDEHPQFGLARNSWLSGTAAWMEWVGTQAILGIRPEYHGIRIDPCIPADWKEFEMKRSYRGAEYHIRVRNPQGICRGVSSLTLDQERIEGNLLPAQPPGIYEVVAMMGPAEAI